MAKTVTPLSDKEIQAAKPKNAGYTLSDGNGLYLRIATTGYKSWVFKYQKPSSKRRTNIGFGGYPSTSLATARKRALEARQLLAEGIDPKEHQLNEQKARRQLAENTLEKVAKDWLEVKKATVSHDHAKDIWRSLELHLFPSLCNHPVCEISPKDAIQALMPLSNRGSLETVKRMTQRLNEIMNYAVNTGCLGTNTLTNITKAFQPPRKAHMATLLPEQLPELMHALKYASIKLPTRIMIEWQLHTMVRPGEAAGTKWEEIDWNNKIWVIPAERMKKNRPHKVPLTPQTIELLEIMQPLSSHTKFVFPSDRNQKKSRNPETANAALKRMGFKGKLVAHGMRALASTTLNEHGFNADIIEAALSHVDPNETRAAYNRAEYLVPRREMMEWWSEQIQLASNYKKITNLKLA